MYIVGLRYRTLAYGVLALVAVRNTQLMSTMMVPVGYADVPVAVPQLEVVPASAREVLKCEHCKLVQFRTEKDCCRRCKKSLLPEPPKIQAISTPIAESHIALKNEGLSVAMAVRDLRHVRNLSQRQLAARMSVPRTYISKIENGKAMPTLSSLDRLARALQVDISALLRDTPNHHHRDETAVLMADPFLAEIAKFSAHLTSTQKSIFLNHVRELAQNTTQSTNKNGIRRTA